LSLTSGQHSATLYGYRPWKLSESVQGYNVGNSELKPLSFWAFSGTAEAVPFRALRGAQAPLFHVRAGFCSRAPKESWRSPWLCRFVTRLRPDTPGPHGRARAPVPTRVVALLTNSRLSPGLRPVWITGVLVAARLSGGCGDGRRGQACFDRRARQFVAAKVFGFIFRSFF
jgi:hypothetical protein